MTRVSTNDIVMTPDWVAADVMSYFPVKGKLLEPCRGDGAFYNLMPSGSDWAEIRQGRDFFDYRHRVDWIVTNPPYSIFNSFLDHALNIATNIVFIIPVPKLMASYVKLDKIYAWGSIREVRYYGTGRQLGFPFGFPVGAFWLVKSRTRDTMKISFAVTPNKRKRK